VRTRQDARRVDSARQRLARKAYQAYRELAERGQEKDWVAVARAVNYSIPSHPAERKALYIRVKRLVQRGKILSIRD
jgi:hypothetical protein